MFHSAQSVCCFIRRVDKAVFFCDKILEVWIVLSMVWLRETGNSLYLLFLLLEVFVNLVLCV